VPTTISVEARSGAGSTYTAAMLALRRSAGLVPALALAALCASGCGSDSAESGADASSPAATTPSASALAAAACSEVWKDGAQLPRSYRGCAEDDQLVKPDVLGCSSGQRMVRYADRYYAVYGGTVHEATPSLEKDRDYRAAVLSCRA
jgi:hypothetical protein